ncbi:MAG: RusA family crossover junction endodeoxyribonuclease [Ruminococcus flavefaciens]|nr:RusA family crossover junction endodeoxyribonuclease [Ruminococcus flavefaciens]
MKFKSRKEKMLEYNQKYQVRTSDPDALVEAMLRSYIDQQKNPEKVIAKAREKALRIINDREYETIHILMYEYPFKTDRPRTMNGHTWSPNAAENKSYFDRALKKINQTLKLINTPGEVEIEAYLEMPRNVPPDEVILFETKLLKPVDKPDYDNIGKCYTDMFTWILTVDDDIFWRGEIRKYYSLLPRVDIVIRYVKKHESDYIYKKLKSRKSIKEGIASGQIILEKLEEK